MKRLKKVQKILAIALLLTVLIAANSGAIYAKEVTQDPDTVDLQGSVEGNVMITLPSEGAITAENYVSNYKGFYTYKPSKFSYREATCGPIVVANTLSYFQMCRGVRLFENTSDIITESIFNQICTDVNWDSGGTNALEVANGLTTFCNRAGKTCVLNKYALNLWSDVTRDIDANKPIIMGYDGHFYLVLGYVVKNNVKYLRVCAGTDNVMWAYVKFPGYDGQTSMRSVNIY